MSGDTAPPASPSYDAAWERATAAYHQALDQAHDDYHAATRALGDPSVDDSHPGAARWRASKEQLRAAYHARCAAVESAYAAELERLP